MAREYPRFLFSNPKKIKSPGPFVVHLLYPMLICRATLTKSDDQHTIQLELLKCFDADDEKEIDNVMIQMNKWLFSQFNDDLIEF